MDTLNVAVIVIGFLSSVILGHIVLFRNPRNILNRLYMGFSLIVGYWEFIDLNIYFAPSYAIARIWSIFDALWFLCLAFLYHFTLIYTDNKRWLKKKGVLFAIYGIPIIFALIDLPTNLLTGGPEAYEGTWYLSYFPTDIGYYLTDVWAFGTFFIALYLYLRHFFKTKSRIKRQQLKIILLGFSLALFNVLQEEVCYAFSDNCITIPVSSIIIVAVFIGIAMWRYELFSLDLAAAADTIVSTMSDMMFLLDEELNIILTNSITQQILNKSKDQIVGKSFTDILGKSNYERVTFKDVALPTILKRGHIVDFETSIDTAPNIRVPLSLSCTVIKDKRGDIAGIVCIARDITKRKQEEELIQAFNEKLIRTEANVQEKEARHQAILLSIGDGLFVTDLTGKITLVNRSFEEMLGWASSDVIGKSIDKIVPMVDRKGKEVTLKERLSPYLLIPGKKITSMKKTFFVSTETYYFVKKDKSKIKVLVVSTPIIFRWEAIGYVHVFRSV